MAVDKSRTKMKVDKKIRSIKVSVFEASNGVSWLHYE